MQVIIIGLVNKKEHIQRDQQGGTKNNHVSFEHGTPPRHAIIEP